MNDALYRRTDRWLASAAGEEILMMHIENGRFQGLNASGAILWERLAEPCGRGALIDALMAAFEVDAAQAGADVDAFLADLMRTGALERADA